MSISPLLSPHMFEPNWIIRTELKAILTDNKPLLAAFFSLAHLVSAMLSIWSENACICFSFSWCCSPPNCCAEGHRNFIKLFLLHTRLWLFWLECAEQLIRWKRKRNYFISIDCCHRSSRLWWCFAGRVGRKKENEQKTTIKQSKGIGGDEVKWKRRRLLVIPFETLFFLQPNNFSIQLPSGSGWMYSAHAISYSTQTQTSKWVSFTLHFVLSFFVRLGKGGDEMCIKKATKKLN